MPGRRAAALAYTAPMTPAPPLDCDWFDTPLGMLTIAGDDAGLRHVLFPENRHRGPNRTRWRRAPDRLAAARRQLLEYFDGRRRHFELDLAPAGTPFQLATWEALRRIPYGQTCSYAELARRIGRPDAVRAVGAANGRNPLPIVVPCHRVIGADGRLVGFGGGLPAKRLLLQREGVMPARDGGDLFA